MKQSVNMYEFEQAFRTYERDNFSFKGLQALFEYLEEYEDSCGEEIELDVVALCCEFTEYANLDEVKENYTDIETLEDLENNTTVIPVGNEGLIIQDY